MRLDRTEYKYLVPLSDLSRLRKAIAPYVEADLFTRAGAVNQYTVRSIYFDNIQLSDYYEKEAGLLKRKKIRLRGYNEYTEDSPVFFEIKRKHNMNIAKSRGLIPYKQVLALFGEKAGGASDRPEPIAQTEEIQRFLYHIHRHSLRPTTLVTYEREAYFFKFKPSLRLTFDKDLRGYPFPSVGDLYRDQTRQVLPGHFVFEVKFSGGIPSWLKLILRDFALSRQAISKYCICIEKLGVISQSSRFAILAAAV